MPTRPTSCACRSSCRARARSRKPGAARRPASCRWRWKWNTNQRTNKRRALPAIRKRFMPEFEKKICSRGELRQRVAALPKPVVLTNGVFDLLHRGHVTYLAQARELGASLVVAVNTDASVRRLGKGDDRPLNTQADRMAVLAALESVS